MIILKDGSVEVRIIGTKNVVLNVKFQSSSAQLNMRKIKNKWEFTYKKDDIDWDQMLRNNAIEYFKYRFNNNHARKKVIELDMAPKLDEYIATHFMEKILLH